MVRSATGQSLRSDRGFPELENRNIVSYDLMVFEPAAAPHERAEFMDWYDRKTEWTESHSYDDPVVCSAKLRAWKAYTVTFDLAQKHGVGLKKRAAE